MQMDSLQQRQLAPVLGHSCLKNNFNKFSRTKGNGNDNDKELTSTTSNRIAKQKTYANCGLAVCPAINAKPPTETKRMEVG